jgi:membrane protein DedA with SNARE-associated domain
MSAVTSWLQTLSGPGVYAIVALLVFAEDALFVGFVLPGETAVVLGGVAASGHNGVQLWALMLVVAGAAILGDSAGYEAGRRFGPALLKTRPARRHRGKIDRAREFIRNRGAAAVLLGRFVSFLRALVPTLAGISGIRYRQFLAYNAAGGLVWAAGYTLLGYLAGNAYARVQGTAGTIAAIVVGALVLTAIAWRTWRHHHPEASHESEPEQEPDHANADLAPGGPSQDGR